MHTPSSPNLKVSTFKIGNTKIQNTAEGGHIFRNSNFRFECFLKLELLSLFRNSQIRKILLFSSQTLPFRLMGHQQYEDENVHILNRNYHTLRERYDTTARCNPYNVDCKAQLVSRNSRVGRELLVLIFTQIYLRCLICEVKKPLLTFLTQHCM